MRRVLVRSTTMFCQHFFFEFGNTMLRVHSCGIKLFPRLFIPRCFPPLIFLLRLGFLLNIRKYDLLKVFEYKQLLSYREPLKELNSLKVVFFDAKFLFKLLENAMIDRSGIFCFVSRSGCSIIKKILSVQTKDVPRGNYWRPLCLHFFKCRYDHGFVLMVKPQRAVLQILRVPCMKSHFIELLRVGCYQCFTKQLHAEFGHQIPVVLRLHNPPTIMVRRNEYTLLNDLRLLCE